jgi:hypothetical protein
MADAEYHRKQAKILAGLALSTSDRKEAAGLSLLAAEHMVQAEQSDGRTSSQGAAGYDDKGVMGNATGSENLDGSDN